jgi:sulfatase maturation enzyme AslB (radical SAM superfamily)
MAIKEVIKNTKYNPDGELIVYLFEHCNLTCQFCPQNHDSTLGMDAIKEKAEHVKLAIDAVKKKGKTGCVINIMGGEIFSDFIQDEYFDDYKFLVNELRTYSKQIGFPIQLHFATNLVFTLKERIKKFLQEIDIPIFVSYDPAGRFNTKTIEIFYENTKYFKEHISQIGCVMTRPSMEKIKSKSAPYFDELYENFDTVFDHFSAAPGIDGKFLAPTDAELRDFYQFMYDNYPRSNPFCNLPIKGNQPMSCMQTMQVMANNSITTCGHNELGVIPFIDVTGKQTRNAEIMSPMEDLVETKWFEDYNCLMCEHMQRCSFSCFLNNHMSQHLRTQDECWLKEVYDYVDKKD